MKVFCLIALCVFAAAQALPNEDEGLAKTMLHDQEEFEPQAEDNFDSALEQEDETEDDGQFLGHFVPEHQDDQQLNAMELPEENGKFMEELTPSEHQDAANRERRSTYNHNRNIYVSSGRRASQGNSNGYLVGVRTVNLNAASRRTRRSAPVETEEVEAQSGSRRVNYNHNRNIYVHSGRSAAQRNGNGYLLGVRTVNLNAASRTRRSAPVEVEQSGQRRTSYNHNRNVYVYSGRNAAQANRNGYLLGVRTVNLNSASRVQAQAPRRRNNNRRRSTSAPRATRAPRATTTASPTTRGRRSEE